MTAAAPMLVSIFAVVDFYDLRLPLQ